MAVQRPPHRIDVLTLGLADDVKIVSLRPQGRFLQYPLQYLEVVGKLGPPYQSDQMQLYLYWVGSSSYTILLLEVWTIPYRLQTLLNTLPFS